MTNDFSGIPDEKLNMIELALDTEARGYEEEARDALALGQFDRARDLDDDAREHYRLMNEVKEARSEHRAARAEAR